MCTHVTPYKACALTYVCSDVDVDDVSVLQLPLVRDAVADDLGDLWGNEARDEAGQWGVRESVCARACVYVLRGVRVRVCV